MELAELSIKITIANRIYPLTIQASEEETIRKAAKYINESIKNYSENYSTRDKQDLLAMVALEVATKLLEEKRPVDTDEVVKKLTEVSKSLAEEIDNL